MTATPPINRGLKGEQIVKKYSFIVFVIVALLGVFFVKQADVVRTEHLHKKDYTIHNVLEYDYEDITTYKVRLASGEKYGYILRTTGQWVVPPQFDEAFSFGEGLAEVRVSGKWGYINKTGKMVIEPQFDAFQGFGEGIAPVVVNGKWGYIDKMGKMLIAPQFGYVRGFSEGLAAVSVNSKEGFIDRTGRLVIAPQFDYAPDFHGGLTPVRVSGKSGFIDKTGKMAIAPQFDHASIFGKTSHWFN
jgi:hypothetical protein